MKTVTPAALAQPLRIGSVQLKNRLILGPMAGVSDLPFRVLCAEQGAGLVCTEMISAKAVTYGNKNTGELTKIDPSEHPVSLQLFGSEPQVMAEAAGMLAEVPFDMLDVNMGCPVPKVAGHGEGSALMKDPKLCGEIIRALTAVCDRPVTAKIRMGFDADHINAVEVALALEEAGAAAVAVHGRTREQYYSGSADWNIIREVKEAVHIPVIGNGDVQSPEDVLCMLEQTGCDAVMIARGARGNPWIFSRCLTYAQTGEDPGRPDILQLQQMLHRHAAMQAACKGEYTGIREMRKHVAWYTAGYPHSARLRAKVNEAQTMEDLTELLSCLNGIAAQD